MGIENIEENFWGKLWLIPRVKKRLNFTRDEVVWILGKTPEKEKSKSQKDEMKAWLHSSNWKKKELLKDILAAYKSCDAARRINSYNFLTDITDIPAVAMPNQIGIALLALSFSGSALSMLHKSRYLWPKIKSVKQSVTEIGIEKSGIEKVTDYENYIDIFESLLEAIAMFYAPARIWNIFVIAELWTDMGFREELYRIQEELYILAKSIHSSDNI